MWFLYFVAFLMFIWLPAQWVNGASLGESLAPNEPVMAIFWIIVLFFIFFPLYMKFRDEGIEEDKARKMGLVDKNASRDEAIVSYRQAKFEKQQMLCNISIEYRELYRVEHEMLLQAIGRKKRGELSKEEERAIGNKAGDMWARMKEIEKILKENNYPIPSLMGL